MWKVTFALSDPFTPIGIKTIVNDEYANLGKIVYANLGKIVENFAIINLLLPQKHIYKYIE